jgi:hypothetical protein
VKGAIPFSKGLVSLPAGETKCGTRTHVRGRGSPVRIYVKVKEIHARSLSQHTDDMTGRGEREEGAEDAETSLEE